MIIKEKELGYFKLAKKYFNSDPKEYEKSLEEINKISLLIKNITVIHMKTLCLLMLSKYEDIIEFYYINKNHLDSIFDQKNNNEVELNEIRKIISIAFYNLGMRQKAKKICPDIKDDFQTENFHFEIIGKKEKNEEIKVENNIKEDQNAINSNRVNKNIILKNIKNNLDKTMKNKIDGRNEMNVGEKNKNDINLNNSKDLMPLSTEFVDDLFKSAIKSNKLKNIQILVNEQKEEKEEKEDKPINNENKYEQFENNLPSNNNINDGSFMEDEEEKKDTKLSNGTKKSGNSDIYSKLKEEIYLNNINNIKKEDGLYMAFDEKIKDIKIEKKVEKIKDEDRKKDNIDTKNNEKKDDNNIDNIKNGNELNENLKSNRSEKYNKQKEIKGPLNKQKIPYIKKFTNEKISINMNLVKKNEKTAENKIEEKEIKKEDEIKNEDNQKENITIENKEQTNDKENKDIIKTEIEKKEEKKDNNKLNIIINNNNNILKKSYTIDQNISFTTKEIKRIYPKTNNNDKRKDNIHENNKRISDGFIKSCKTYGFKNPFEFTLNPEEGGSFKPILSNSSQNEKNEEEEDKKSNGQENINININDKNDEEKEENKIEGVNINKKRALLRVEIDGEQIDLVPNENPSRKNSKYADYINIDYTEFSNKKRKKMIEKFRDSAVKNFDIKFSGQLPKSTKINSYNLRGIKNINPFSANEEKSLNDNDNTNLKKTCFYKTSYFLDNFDNK